MTLTSEAVADIKPRMDRQARAREAAARAICIACGENPGHAGDAQDDEHRWQHYLPAADAAIRALQANGYCQL